MSSDPKLLTFAPMIDSELWRLLLRYYGVAYQEEPHAFIWGSLLALFRTGSVQVPAFCGARLRLVGPETALERWDGEQPPGRALIPPDPAMRAIANDDFALFHEQLAISTARLAYYHLLPHRRIMLEPFTRGIPRAEASATRVIYPLQRGVLKLLLKLNRKNAEQALTDVRAIFDQTDARVRDGRRFLQGDRPTLGDLALASAAAPVTLPEGSGSPMPPYEQLPPEYAAIVREMRSRLTADFVNRLYRTMFSR